MTEDPLTWRYANVTMTRFKHGFPVIGITGARQTGKTTLARQSFPDKPYITLANPDHLEVARFAPARFLESFASGVILDEAQRCPEIFPHLRCIVDQQPVMGKFVLVSSQQSAFRGLVEQHLAGRIATLQLLPFSSTESRRGGKAAFSLDREMFRGFYPAIFNHLVTPSDWYATFMRCYVERDVQQLLRVKTCHDFWPMLKSCARRIGKPINLSSIGLDAGVSYNTIREWLSVLETTHMTFSLPPHQNNFSKRLIKSPKLYFFDTGLLCWLLGIRSSAQLASHALRSAIFENYVIAELSKHYYSAGEIPPFSFWRDQSGLEIELVIDRANNMQPVAITSAQAGTEDALLNLNRWMKLAGRHGIKPSLVHSDNESRKQAGINILGWQNLEKLSARFEKDT